MNFNFGVAVSLVSIISAVVAWAKLYSEILGGRRGAMREAYKFANEFLCAVKNDQGMHPYLREKGYQAIAGTRSLGVREVEYLLTIKDSDQAIRDYSFGKKYLEHLPDAGRAQIAFKRKYQDARSRHLIKWFYFVLYAGFVVLVFLPGFIPKELIKGDGNYEALLVINVVFFGYFAGSSLRAGARVARAEELIKNQHQHLSQN